MLLVRKGALYLTIISIIVLFAKSMFYSIKYGGTDLRGRIIGSRLIQTPYSPYFYKWNPKDGDYYLDPNAPTRIKANSNTVTPAVLYTIYPIARMPYKKIRITWTLLQFAVAFVCLFLLSDSIKDEHNSYISPVIITALFFICSDLWLYNIERGQIYIFYAFFFSLMYWIYHLKWKFNYFLSGFIGGLFILFRPLAVIVGLGFIIKKNYQWLLGSFTGFILGCFLFVMPNPDYWKQYFAAMKEYNNPVINKQSKIASSPEYNLPTTIDGMNNLTKYNSFSSGGMNTLNNYLARVGIFISSKQSLIIYALVVLALSLIFIKKRAEHLFPDSVFIFGFLLYILFEIFITAPRAGYSVIQWMFPLFISWKYIATNRILLSVYLIAILLLHQFPFLFPYQKDIAELLFILLVLLIIFPSFLQHVSTFLLKMGKIKYSITK